MSPDRMAYYIAFREENADEIRALCIKKNCQIFKDACQQIERMLLGAADTSAVALEILSGLTRTQIVLVSCATVVEVQCFHSVTRSADLRDWTEEEREAFVRKFTSFVDGYWDQERILNDWEELVKVLFDKVWERLSGLPLASSGYPSVWAGVEIWSKLDRLPRETEILRLELVID
ncbi:uncharacterized protein LY89DRAFT_787587 [Mollisia scopiformis]|uniref:Uncharacterized protein n=1 Tax=Mollisia scopiformis TaxID=149040 RepID=A0A132BC78_MOLSC|nr:uncharacterized protein LY89DRAFT_787587 [Mollisia scopiformis]KUJ09873.1 hypothetical protein LY89DRAFT_787587 [Mollisia scopiformis]